MKSNSPVRIVLFIVAALLMLLTLYAIFNAGNPNSLFRLVAKDTSYDIAITVALAVGAFALVLVLTMGRGQNRMLHLLEINAEHIRTLRQKGKSEVFIAESFLSELGVRSGLLYRLAKWRVLRYLSKLE
jgi:predicted Co/Zn/Cd cation transporter (cation efflux family)